MALEKGHGNVYYYRSVRDSQGRPKKVYVGAGEFARSAFEQDTIRRTVQEGERERQWAEIEHLKDLAASLMELDEAAEVLARAALVAAGYHRHKGEWRRERTA